MNPANDYPVESCERYGCIDLHEVMFLFPHMRDEA